MLIYTLLGLIVFLLVFIKYQIDLKFAPDERMWFEKIRTILFVFVIPIFIGIYYYWDHYPERLIEKDNKIQKTEKHNESAFSWPLSSSIIYLSSPNIEEEPKTDLQKIGEKYGTYGDTYGSLNTLFTGLAFAGLIISIFIQMLELRQTRKELANQSKALSEQKSEFSAQTKILEKQTVINTNQQKIINEQFKETRKTNFLNHFLKLIDQKNLLLENLTFPKDGGQIHGISVIIEYANEFRRIRKNFDPEKHDSTFYSKAWENFTKESYGTLNYQVQSYFKIYRVIFFTVHSSKILSDAEKKYYGYVFRMVVSLEEQLVLMWISTFENNLNNFCNKFGLLTGIYNPNMVKTGVTFFKITAFNTDKNWEKAFEEAELKKLKSE
ncbi:putative phage abortive infection protein [Acinetobacter baumannii]|uniref:putative phage abortive infection protein n=1 Tax=Acinetobacter baumannii TaxID=470 RepID=UPI000D3A5D97|nr:putative phage abortive infection protein [Acinetobacter baumannii]MDC4478294.1 hypothetical protein [Acinetobacter baumannii]